MFVNVIGMTQLWAGIMHNERTPLHTFDRGNVTLERHSKEIILDHVRLFEDALTTDFLFTDDNERPHRNT